MTGNRSRAFLRAWAAVLALVVVSATIGACSSQPAPRRGGASFLPGPLAAGASSAPASSGAPTSPDFTLLLVDGSSVTASSLWADRPLVIDFFNSFCSACATAQPDMNKLAQDFKGRVAFLGVAGTPDKADTVGAYLDKYAVPYAVALDPDGVAWLKYAVHEPPLVALVSRGGRLLRGWQSGVDTATLRQALIEQAGTP